MTADAAYLDAITGEIKLTAASSVDMPVDEFLDHFTLTDPDASVKWSFWASASTPYVLTSPTDITIDENGKMTITEAGLKKLPANFDMGSATAVKAEVTPENGGTPAVYADATNLIAVTLHGDVNAYTDVDCTAQVTETANVINVSAGTKLYFKRVASVTVTTGDYFTAVPTAGGSAEAIGEDFATFTGYTTANDQTHAPYTVPSVATTIGVAANTTVVYDATSNDDSNITAPAANQTLYGIPGKTVKFTLTMAAGYDLTKVTTDGDVTIEAGSSANTWDLKVVAPNAGSKTVAETTDVKASTANIALVDEAAAFVTANTIYVIDEDNTQTSVEAALAAEAQRMLRASDPKFASVTVTFSTGTLTTITGAAINTGAAVSGLAFTVAVPGSTPAASATASGVTANFIHAATAAELTADTTGIVDVAIADNISIAGAVADGGLNNVVTTDAIKAVIMKRFESVKDNTAGGDAVVVSDVTVSYSSHATGTAPVGDVYRVQYTFTYNNAEISGETTVELEA